MGRELRSGSWFTERAVAVHRIRFTQTAVALSILDSPKPLKSLGQAFNRLYSDWDTFIVQSSETATNFGPDPFSGMYVKGLMSTVVGC